MGSWLVCWVASLVVMNFLCSPKEQERESRAGVPQPKKRPASYAHREGRKIVERLIYYMFVSRCRHNDYTYLLSNKRSYYLELIAGVREGEGQK
jgi:hypothetical protein